MARFESIDTRSIPVLTNRECYHVRGELTLNDVNSLNKINRPICLIFDNTKGQNSEVIASINSKNISISVMGGLDYLHKNKFRTSEYVQRTFYTSKNLGNIIRIFESIERKIDYTWTETQKAMFIYKTIAEHMHYQRPDERSFENGVDVARTLNSLLAKRSVCSGFALIFKEAMDRIGIECLYQNKAHHHSWNAIKLDGKYHLVDLTWDTYDRIEDKSCGFKYFARQTSEDFYRNIHHDISNDREEIRVLAGSKSLESLQEDYNIISNPRTLYSNEMKHFRNRSNEEFDYTYVGESKGFLIYIVRREDSINYFYIAKNEDIRKYLSDRALTESCKKRHIICGIGQELPKKFARYKRQDGSNFIICKTKSDLPGGVSEYAVIEPAIVNGKKVLKRSTILSETSLDEELKPEYKSVVADRLLSRERLERKLSRFNGYVGFVGRDSYVYYNNEFEREKLGIKRG